MEVQAALEAAISGDRVTLVDRGGGYYMRFIGEAANVFYMAYLSHMSVQTMSVERLLGIARRKGYKLNTADISEEALPAACSQQFQILGIMAAAFSEAITRLQRVAKARSKANKAARTAGELPPSKQYVDKHGFIADFEQQKEQIKTAEQDQLIVADIAAENAKEREINDMSVGQLKEAYGVVCSRLPELQLVLPEKPLGLYSRIL